MTDQQLYQEACLARESAYAPYSKFCVGAALLTQEGKVYHGCNIENAAFTPTVCAERTAFFKAVSQGERQFARIAVVGGAQGMPPQAGCTPCGVCRQVMMEFCDPQTFTILTFDGTDTPFRWTLQDLLPAGFGPSNLN